MKISDAPLDSYNHDGILLGVGDTIRVVQQGEITGFTPLRSSTAGVKVSVRLANGRGAYAYLRPGDDRKVEVVQRAERLEDGAIYIDVDGDVYRWVAHRNEFTAFDGQAERQVRKSLPARPLRKISR